MRTNVVCINSHLICLNYNYICLSQEGPKIIYFWLEGSGADLDTKTSCMGNSVGYSWERNAKYIRVDRDDTSSSGRETVTIKPMPIKNAGRDIVQVSMKACWFGVPKTGKFSIRVIYGDMDETKDFQTKNRFHEVDGKPPKNYEDCGKVTFDLTNRNFIW